MSIAHPTKADLPLVRRSLAARSGRVRASRIRPAMAAGAILVSALAVLPLGFVVAVTASTDWHTIVALVVRPRVAELLVNTVLLLLLTVPIAGALAVALAWLTERSDLPGARFWSWLAVAPLAVPAFVQSYAWTGLFPSLHGLSAAVLVSVLAYFPFVYLPVSASLRRLDPALEEAAASMGLSPGRVVLRVVLPQLRLALCGGALLVGLHLLAEYGLFAMIRFDTFTTAIIDQFQSTYNGPAASMLGAVLVSCCLVLLWLETSLRGTARYAQVGSGAPRPARKTALGRWTALGMLVPLATAALTLGVPFWTLGRWLAIGGAEVWRLGEIGGALWQTVCVALVGGAVTTIAAVPMAWLAVRAPGRLQRLLEGANYVAGALPAVVIALALVAVTVRLPFYQSVVTLLLAYVLLFLPRALLSLRASIAQAPVELEQAAGLLGRSPTAALWQVTLRLAAPGAAAGTALVALGILTELTATQMLAPNGTTTLATGFWSYSAELDYASAAPYALSMVLLSLPLTVVLYRQSRRIAGR